MSDVLSNAAVQADPVIHKLSVADLRRSLSHGFADFTAIPTQLVFLCLLYPLVGIAAARAATNDLLPLLFPLLTGVSLMGPVMAVGLYEISRRREAGLPVSWTTAFDVLRSPAIGSIVLLGAGLLAIFVVWVFTARAIYTATMTATTFDGLGSFARAVVQTNAGHRLAVWGNLVGAGFAVVVMTVSVISFPMLLDRGCSPVLAVRTSVRVVLWNPVVMAVWGLVVAALLIVGSLPAFIGLALVMPILGHATWHLYKRSVL